MNRPVAEILEQARREGWPTSYIDAMANHHLCGGLARDYVNECFVDQRHGPRGDGQADTRQDAAPSGPAGAASPEQED
jgi:hypothetical protein